MTKPNTTTQRNARRRTLDGKPAFITPPTRQPLAALVILRHAAAAFAELNSADAPERWEEVERELQDAIDRADAVILAAPRPRT